LVRAELELLASAACWPPGMSDLMTVKIGDESKSCLILGQKVPLRDINLVRARVCPDCVEDLGFIEATWNINLFVACPVHERPAAWFCPQCKKLLSWGRPAMLRCGCGAPIRSKISQPPISPPETALLNSIRSKALGLNTPQCNKSTFPEAMIDGLPLCELLSFVRHLGKLRRRASGIHTEGFGRDIFRAAVSVLDDWPHGYRKLIADMDRSFKHCEDVPVPATCDDVMTAITAADEARFQDFTRAHAEIIERRARALAEGGYPSLADLQERLPKKVHGEQ
jgi:hypothetical protein